MTRRTLLASASLAALLTATAAPAQDLNAAADSATTLDQIVATGTADPTAPVRGYTATSALAGTKTATPLLETQRSVSVVTRDQMTDQGIWSLGQALDTVAGVNGTPFGDDPRFDSPYIRGFDASYSQYLNGFRLMRSSGAPSIETYGLERIEVLKGPASVLYGAGSPAGIIGMVQKHAQDRNFGETGFGISDTGNARAFFDLNKAVNDRFDYRLTGLLSRTEGQADDLTNSRGYLALATHHQIGEATTLDLLASYQKDSPKSPVGIPYALADQGNARTLRDLNLGESDRDSSDRKMTNVGYELKHDFGNGWSLSQSLQYQRFRWTYFNYYANGASDGSSVSRGATSNVENDTTISADAHVEGQFATGRLTHDLLLGLDVRRYTEKTTMGFYTASSYDLDDPSTLVPVTGAAPWWSGSVDETLTQTGLYAQDQLSFGNWRSTLGLRHDWTQEEGTSYGSAFDQNDEKTTGQAGLSYLFDSGIAPYVSYATSFDPVVGSDAITGSKLKPTEGAQWEAGVKYQPNGFDGYLSAAVYDLRQKNVSVATSVDGIAGTYQLGEVKSQGIELEAGASLGAGWGVKAAYAHNETEQVSGSYDGNEMPNAPRDMASLWLTYAFADSSPVAGLSLSGGLRYIGERYGDQANAYEMGEVTLLDIGAKYAFANGMVAALNVSNLTDEAYVSTCTASYGCYYGAGRTVQASLTFKW